VSKSDVATCCYVGYLAARNNEQCQIPKIVTNTIIRCNVGTMLVVTNEPRSKMSYLFSFSFFVQDGSYQSTTNYSAAHIGNGVLCVTSLGP